MNEQKIRDVVVWDFAYQWSNDARESIKTNLLAHNMNVIAWRDMSPVITNDIESMAQDVLTILESETPEHVVMVVGGDYTKNWIWKGLFPELSMRLGSLYGLGLTHDEDASE